MATTTGARLMTTLLERQGVTTIAGIPGGSNLPLYDALSESSRIRHVLTRHEQGAGFIAQGMARVTGRPGVCLATSGPGATNLLTAIADARLDSIPMVAITGQVPSGMIGSDAFQEVDTYGMSIPCTKHNYLVRSAEELAEVVPAAFRIASGGRPGPVLIDVPKDVQAQEVELDELPEPGRPDVPPEVDHDAVTRAAEMIDRAERPVLYLGGGVVAGGGSKAARRLAETASIPTTMTLLGLGAIPTDHELAIGMLGMHAARYTNLVLEETDLLVVAGARFDDRATGKLAEFCPRAKVVHIDIDAAELGKNRAADVGIVGDVVDVLEALADAVQPRDRHDWLGRVKQLKEQHPLVLPGGDDPMRPYGLVRAACRAAGDRGIYCTDVGRHQMWAAQACTLRRPRRWLTSGGLGTMGFGLPAAIGAALAEPDAPVVCFTGDGSLMMNIQELATAADLEANVKIVLFNNNSLGLVRQQQALFYGGRVFASDFVPGTDFCAIARGFGIGAVDLSERADPEAALHDAINQPGPMLVHARIDAEEHVYPMVPPGGANREMIGGQTYANA
ncbi:MAG: acetolactate synthase large subunit [Planctomycetota bacterium]